MFDSGDFWDKSYSWVLENLKLPSFYSGNFKIFKNVLEQFISNRPPKHVITSTNLCIYLFHDGGRYHIETIPLICGAKSIYDNGLRHERVNI